MFYHDGKLIVLEGGDGSGKATQAKLLTIALARRAPTNFFTFPRYTKSAFGDLIRRSLDGEFGNFLKLSPYLASLPYTLDRVRAKYLLLEMLKDGHVVCDRYTPSNLAYQAAKLPLAARPKFVNFLEQGEYGELGLPKPDLVIYLHVPALVAAKLIVARAKPDQHEANLAYQAAVIEMYLTLAKSRKNWHIVRCVKNGKLRSRAEIHKEVFSIVDRHILC